jgi:hypothetical protein
MGGNMKLDIIGGNAAGGNMKLDIIGGMLRRKHETGLIIKLEFIKII